MFHLVSNSAGKLECLGSVDHTVGISKHLCGAATGNNASVSVMAS